MAAKMSNQTDEIGQELMQIIAEKEKLVAEHSLTTNDLQKN